MRIVLEKLFWVLIPLKWYQGNICTVYSVLPPPFLHGGLKNQIFNVSKKGGVMLFEFLGWE